MEPTPDMVCAENEFNSIFPSPVTVAESNVKLPPTVICAEFDKVTVGLFANHKLPTLIVPELADGTFTSMSASISAVCDAVGVAPQLQLEVVPKVLLVAPTQVFVSLTVVMPNTPENTLSS